ncbi:hypothetical protein H1220_01255 [Carnobacteriaceae bacterium zg-84]|uniref:hypothetical protein n=1 Tax=Granulicatella sp. zg-84 TaxID=2678503 RepID=UPI0013BF9B2E|nr:hypothetical protein [Granulicatella sp. zg-84]NEW66486.1 hypothetical protein [Granulicatella sp. zg-84]QMI86029.1 hypothetical protein H1220_01255 [Carnobacteriaceae bacterium zg-84]
MAVYYLSEREWENIFKKRDIHLDNCTVLYGKTIQTKQAFFDIIQKSYLLKDACLKDWHTLSFGLKDMIKDSSDRVSLVIFDSQACFSLESLEEKEELLHWYKWDTQSNVDEQEILDVYVVDKALTNEMLFLNEHEWQKLSETLNKEDCLYVEMDGGHLPTYEQFCDEMIKSFYTQESIKWSLDTFENEFRGNFDFYVQAIYLVIKGYAKCLVDSPRHKEILEVIFRDTIHQKFLCYGCTRYEKVFNIY